MDLQDRERACWKTGDLQRLGHQTFAGSVEESRGRRIGGGNPEVEVNTRRERLQPGAQLVAQEGTERCTESRGHDTASADAATRSDESPPHLPRCGPSPAANRRGGRPYG